jgi:hypothetical protein
LGYISEQLSIVRIPIDRKLGIDAMCDSLAHEFSSGGVIGSAESTKRAFMNGRFFEGRYLKILRQQGLD